MSLRTRLLACLLALAPLSAFAQQPPAAAALPAWDQLSAEQRELLLGPVRDRWNRSAPEDRRDMLDHARRWQSMTPEQRERARDGHKRWKGMSPEQREHARHGMKRWRGMPPEKREEARALFEHIRPLPDAERKAMLERWKAMTPEQRKAWVEAHPPKDPPKSR